MEDGQPAAEQQCGCWVQQWGGDAARPELVYCCWQAFAEQAGACPNTNFLKGVQWAPDGSCCLTASDDNWLRVFGLPQDVMECQPAEAEAAEAATAWQPGVAVHTGETVYDCCFFSGMASADPVSCCFASTSRGQPISLWDACSGSLRASYRGYDDADEVTAAYSLAFSPDGARLVAGYSRCLRVFDVAKPGRDCARLMTHRKKQEGSIPGIISCVAFNTMEPDLFAAGSYSRAMGLFDVRTREQLLLLEGHAGGITQVAFSPDGNYLYSGARRDAFIHCWDIRATGQVLYSLQRATACTNQRVRFSIEACGRHLATGGCDGCVRVFDLSDGQLVAEIQAADDTVNGASFSPCLPLLATASGHRRYPLLHDDDGGGADADASLRVSSCQPGGGSNGLRLWRLQAQWQQFAAAGGGSDAVEEAGGV